MNMRAFSVPYFVFVFTSNTMHNQIITYHDLIQISSREVLMHNLSASNFDSVAKNSGLVEHIAGKRKRMGEIIDAIQEAIYSASESLSPWDRFALQLQDELLVEICLIGAETVHDEI